MQLIDLTLLDFSYYMASDGDTVLEKLAEL